MAFRFLKFIRGHPYQRVITMTTLARLSQSPLRPIPRAKVKDKSIKGPNAYKAVSPTSVSVDANRAPAYS